MRCRLGAVLLAVVVGGCDCEEPVAQLFADIVVEPAALSFGAAIVGAEATATLQVGNRGDDRLTLTATVEPGDTGFRVLEAPAVVTPLSAEPLQIGFTPPAQAAFAATLILTSNDPDTPRLEVPLDGAGGPPVLSVRPDPIDLGRVNEGQGATARVVLENTGFDTLAITSVALQSGAAFVLTVPTPSTALFPGESLPVDVSLQPVAEHVALLDAGVLRDALLVTSNDPADGPDGVRRVPVTATLNLAPVAQAVELITRREVVKASLGRAITVDGSDTVDPEGDTFSFLWSLPERPEGSIAALVGQGQPTTRVTPDAVGGYRVRLRATDVHGAFREDDLVILPRDLTFELTWDASASSACRAYTPEECAALPDPQAVCCGQSDLDLHVIAPGGTLGDYGACPGGCSVEVCAEVTDEHVDTCRSTGTDCAYANRFPEWGAVGRVDDPRLDVDDVRGFGPELTSIDDPADGVYRAVVHYCRDRIDEDVLATLRIFEEGVLVQTIGPQRIDDQGAAWSAANLVREDGAWTIVAVPGIFEADVPANLCTQ